MLLPLLLAVLLLGLQPSSAQVAPLGSLGSPGEPLEIVSEEGFELFQERQLVIAKGNVVVRQGETELRADLLSASYRDEDGSRAIHRLDAVGNVRIATEKEKMYGEHATYDLERELFLLTGGNLRIEGQDQTISASKSLEYWGNEDRAVARGDATAIQHADDMTLRAEVIEAQLGPRKGTESPASKSSPDKLALNELRAWGGVTITTPNEIVQGERGVYNASKNLATLEGGVRITRGKNQLNGERAIVDLEMGVSKLVSAPGQQVQSIFYPGSEASAPSGRPEERSQDHTVVPRPRPVDAP